MDFTLPELGEQIEAGDVLRVLVKAGDTLTKDQPVLELETDKATIEVPSSVAGTIKEIKVKAGEKVKVGQAIFSYEAGAGEPASPKPAAAGEGGKQAAAKAQPAKADAPAAAGGARAKAAPARAAAPARPAAESPVEKIDANEEGQPDVEVDDKSNQPDN